MLDESLPTFFLSPSKTNPKQSASFYFSQHGTDPAPQYSLRYPDPTTPSGSNRYAIALFDSYNPDVLFGEVLIIPEWTQPTLSQEAIRLNGGVVPPPEPILPTQFTIQLYNPDQQVVVSQRSKKWASTPQWEFEMPEKTFRIPSQAAVDRALSDPAALDATPKLSFAWRKDGKLSKDLTCFLSGKSRNPDGSKKKHREPDITVGIFKGAREVTIYEPNMCRVEMEDPKGLEVVMLLSCCVIKDVFMGAGKEVFNVTDVPKGPIAAPTTEAVTTEVVSPMTPATVATAQHPPQSHRPKRPSITIPSSTASPSTPQPQPQVQAPSHPKSKQKTSSRPPKPDARTQWTLNEEQRRIKKMLAAEEAAKKKREDAVKKETERLTKMYGRGQVEAFAASQANILQNGGYDVPVMSTPGLISSNPTQPNRPAQGVRFASTPVILGHGALGLGAGASTSTTTGAGGTYYTPPRGSGTPAPHLQQQSGGLPRPASVPHHLQRISNANPLGQIQPNPHSSSRPPRANTPAAHGPYFIQNGTTIPPRPQSGFFSAHPLNSAHSALFASQAQAGHLQVPGQQTLRVPIAHAQQQQLQQKPKLKEKKSFFGFMRSGSGGEAENSGASKLAKKRSSMF